MRSFQVANHRSLLDAIVLLLLDEFQQWMYEHKLSVEMLNRMDIHTFLYTDSRQMPPIHVDTPLDT